jgi:hypothetical protein
MPVPLPAVLLPLRKHCCTQPNAFLNNKKNLTTPPQCSSGSFQHICSELSQFWSDGNTRDNNKKHSTEAHTVSRSKASVGIWTRLMRRAPRAHKKPSGREKNTQTTEMFVRERKRTRLFDVIVDTFLDECATLRCNKTHTWLKQGSTNRDPYGGRGILLQFAVRLFRSRWKKEDDDDDVRCIEQQQRLRCFPQLRATLDKGPQSRVQWNRAFLLVKSFKLIPRPLNKGPGPRQIKWWFSLHGIILKRENQLVQILLPLPPPRA